MMPRVKHYAIYRRPGWAKPPVEYALVTWEVDMYAGQRGVTGESRGYASLEAARADIPDLGQHEQHERSAGDEDALVEVWL